MATNAAMTYQNNKINTASPAELTLMLYEAAVKNCNLAISAIDDKEDKHSIEKSSNYILHTQRIIAEFQATLDRKYPVSKEFDKVYDYIYRRLVEANIKKDKEILEEVLDHLRGMRDTWKEVMRISKHQPMSQ